MVQYIVILSIAVSFLFITFANRNFNFSISNSTLRLTALVVFILLSANLFAQSDTVVAYDAKEHKVLKYYSVPFDTSKGFDNTGYNFGTEAGFTELNLEKPLKTPRYSGFTDIVPAHQFFRVTDYPVRTAVKIYRYINGSLFQQCSGTLVGRNLVLTASHCLCNPDSIYYYVDNDYLDSLYVIPAFDNKQTNGDFGGSVSKKYYIPQNGFKNFWGSDIAIIELDEPIGEKTGWIGIGYSSDESFFRRSVFHKFSYPGTRSWEDTTRIYDGDTLYYNYGTLNVVNTKELGYGIIGIPGQSGSSLFYTDNKVYYALGVMNRSANSIHKRIDNRLFYSFKSIIEVGASEVNDFIAAVSDYRLFNAYPNPFNPSTVISYSIPKLSYVELKIIDMLGREVSTLVSKEQHAGEYKVQFNASSLPSGVYIYTIRAGQFRDSKKIMLLK